MVGEIPSAPLAQAFTSSLRSETPIDETEAQQLLEAIVVECRRTWPEIKLEPSAFARYLGERVAVESSLRAALAATRHADLYLACACVAGDSAALASLDAEHILRVVRAPLGSIPAVRDTEELAQRLRVRLLVAENGQVPRLATYSGRSPLQVWLRVAAARLAVDQHRADTNQARPTSAVLSGPVDQELLYIKQAHGELFGAALDAALSSLGKRARTVLRLHFLEGVAVAQIATSYAVSPRSVQRWIIAAQTEVIDQLRSVLASQLELTGSQLESLMGVMQTELVIALRQFFDHEH